MIVLGLPGYDADLRPVRQPDDDGISRLDEILLGRAEIADFGCDQASTIDRRSYAASPPRDAIDEEYPTPDASEHEVRTADEDIRSLASRLEDRLPGARDQGRRPAGGVEIRGHATLAPT